MLKIQVAAGIYALGREVAILKLMYRISSTLSAEKPCKANINTKAKTKSKLSRAFRRPSAVRLVLDLIDPLAVSGVEAPVIDSNALLSRGCRTKRMARYGMLSLKPAYCPSELSTFLPNSQPSDSRCSYFL